MLSANQLKGLFLVNFLITLGFGIADAFFSMYVFSLGARGALLALPLVLYSAAKIFLGPILGCLADRIGKGRTLAASLGLYLVVSLCYFLTSRLSFITFLRLVQGGSCAMFRPVLFALVGETVPRERRSSVMGTFDISFYAALGVGPALGGVLKDLYGYRGIFAVLTVLCALSLLIGRRCIRGIGGSVAASAPADLNLCRFVRPRAMLGGLLAFIFGRACCISLWTSFLPIILTAKLQLSGTRAGLVMGTGTVVTALLLRPVGRFSDRVPRRTLIAMAGTGASFLYLLVPLMAGFEQAMGLAAGIGALCVLSQPASSALLLEEGARYGMGRTVGTFNTALNLGLVCGPLVGTAVQDVFGLAAVFSAAGILSLTTVVLFVMCVGGDEKTLSSEGETPVIL